MLFLLTDVYGFHSEQLTGCYYFHVSIWMKKKQEKNELRIDEDVWLTECSYFLTVMYIYIISSKINLMGYLGWLSVSWHKEEQQITIYKIE